MGEGHTKGSDGVSSGRLGGVLGVYAVLSQDKLEPLARSRLVSCLTKFATYLGLNGHRQRISETGH